MGKCFWDELSGQCGEQFPLGNTTLTYTVYDARGSHSTCSFTITVEDLNECEVYNPLNGQGNGGCGDSKKYRCHNIQGDPSFIPERITPKGGYYDGERIFYPDCEDKCNDDGSCTSCKYAGREPSQPSRFSSAAVNHHVRSSSIGSCTHRGGEWSKIR